MIQEPLHLAGERRPHLPEKRLIAADLVIVAQRLNPEAGIVLDVPVDVMAIRRMMRLQATAGIRTLADIANYFSNQPRITMQRIRAAEGDAGKRPFQSSGIAHPFSPFPNTVLVTIFSHLLHRIDGLIPQPGQHRIIAGETSQPDKGIRSIEKTDGMKNE
ncbi:MAG: hypothetical protein BWY83_02536 [bacterium ADurb.Bin478]|nr:MAG: hypothetical protein BWY83_02536 [bacterium ADurb.Bin478]